jgi:hypothetical protein
MSVDAPLALQEEWVVCSISAAVKYQVPANIVLAIAEKERGKPWQWTINKNGTQDVGSMQFNTAYIADLARYGITTSDVAAAGCYSFELAAWRLRQHLFKDNGDLWTRAANYHSRTAQYNHVYRADLIRKAAKWADWLDARFETLNMFRASPTQPPENNKQVVRSLAKPQEEKATVYKGKDRRLQVATAGYVPRILIADKPSAVNR